MPEQRVVPAAFIALFVVCTVGAGAVIAFALFGMAVAMAWLAGAAIVESLLLWRFVRDLW